MIADLARYDQMRDSVVRASSVQRRSTSWAAGCRLPESLIGVGAKGASLLWRLAKGGLQQGAANLAIDPGVQGLNIKAGVQEDYDPLRHRHGRRPRLRHRRRGEVGGGGARSSGCSGAPQPISVK